MSNIQVIDNSEVNLISPRIHRQSKIDYNVTIRIRGGYFVSTDEIYGWIAWQHDPKFAMTNGFCNAYFV